MNIKETDVRKELDELRHTELNCDVSLGMSNDRAQTKFKNRLRLPVKC